MNFGGKKYSDSWFVEEKKLWLDRDILGGKKSSLGTEVIIEVAYTMLTAGFEPTDLQPFRL